MSMPARRHTAAGLLALTLALSGLAPRAFAAPVPAGAQAGQPVQAAASETGKTHSDPLCGIVELPLIGRVVERTRLRSRERRCR